jgi:DNA polymerase-2
MNSLQTGLGVSLDGLYRWSLFSRLTCERVPVANRILVSSDGSLKVRGIEVRRRDSPPCC